ncbi:MAG: GGDEF domain-containing protein [Lachnospiraceae bacterium]|nr:GGDEF domain-containing protein [Lachnospiraceae bacterium]
MYNQFLQDLVQLNFLPLGIILFLVVFLLFNYTYEKELTRQFIPPLILLLCLIIDDNLDYYLLNGRSASVVHVLTAVLGYNIRIFLMLSLILIAARTASRREKCLLLIPAGINLCITCLAFFTRLVFWYGPDGTTFRGPLSYTPHVTSLIYALVLFWYAFRCHQQGKTHEGVIISIAVILCLMGTLVETLFALRGILIGVIAMDVTFYYLYIHIEYFKVDILTGTLNRLSFYADIEMYKQKRSSVYILSVDLNGLKQINDTYGHTAGDEAIKYAANFIRDVIPSTARLYRIGGDEFVVLYPRDGSAYSLSAELISQARNAKYTFAVGEALWETESSFEKAYSEADSKMYACKKKQKGL